MTPRSPTGSLTELGEPTPDLPRASAASWPKPMRYGENPHQSAAFYRTPEQRPGVATARQVQGKQLSYNNINDTDAAYRVRGRVRSRRAPPPCVIIKHANPCGVAEGATLLEAYRKALRCDPVSAFGGIVALNRPLDAEAARAIVEIFTEVIIAPDADEEAIAIVAAKKNLRLLLAGGLPDPRAAGPDRAHRSPAASWRRPATTPWSTTWTLKVVTQARADRARARRPALRLPRRQAREVERHRLRQGRRHRRHRRRPDEPRRFRPHRRAQGGGRRRGSRPAARPLAKGSVVASDAFFPFADGLLAAAEAGATAVIQPGGSMRDDEVIEAADEARPRHGLHRAPAFPALGHVARGSAGVNRGWRLRSGIGRAMRPVLPTPAGERPQ